MGMLAEPLRFSDPREGPPQSMTRAPIMGTSECTWPRWNCHPLPDLVFRILGIAAMHPQSLSQKAEVSFSPDCRSSSVTMIHDISVISSTASQPSPFFPDLIIFGPATVPASQEVLWSPVHLTLVGEILPKVIIMSLRLKPFASSSLPSG